MAASQFHPGKINVDSVIIKSTTKAADITDLFVEFAIDSSIIDPTAVGDLLLTDSTNLLAKFPIEPGNQIEVKISYQDVQKTFFMYIYNLDRMSTDDKQRFYVVKMVSKLAYQSYFKSVEGALSGTTSEIAKGIFYENTDEKINVWEQSSGKQKLVIPRWDPIYTIKWLAGRSVWPSDNVRFRFFQDSNLQYNFMPIEAANVKHKEPIFSYNYNMDTTTIGPTQIPNSMAVMQSVTNVKYEPSHNLRNMVKTGAFGGVRYAPNIVQKSYEPIAVNYHENFSKERYLNSHPLIKKSEYIDAGFPMDQYDVNTSFLHNDIQGLNKISDTSNIRKSNIDNLQNLTIRVVGNQVIDIGQVILFNMSSPEPKSQTTEEVRDMRFSGKYYVTSKRDIYKRDTHDMALGISKESLLEVL